MSEINNLLNTLPKRFKPVIGCIKMQEKENALVTTRLTQEISTNLLPKIPFFRTFADGAEITANELTENILVYFGPKILGENVFRKLYSKKLSAAMKDMVATPAQDLMKNLEVAENDKKRLMAIKAAIAVSALAIPLAEYSLSYFKNIFTLKLFKQADFKNIANLDKSKNKTEDVEKQNKVKESAKKHIKLAGGLFAGCLAISGLLLARGKQSKALNQVSEFILAPGSKLFKNNAKRAVGFNKYFGLDFANNNGKLTLSRGQLTACVVAGFFGYSGAAKDRGKQNYLEVLYRFPLVGLYAITGSELVEKGFKTALKKAGKCKELLSYEKMPKLSELPEIAEELSSKNGTTVEQEFKKLFKQKSTLIMVPFMFGIVVMGGFVAGLSRFFTQYRYNKELASQKNNPFNNNSQKFEMSSFGQNK